MNTDESARLAEALGLLYIASQLRAARLPASQLEAFTEANRAACAISQAARLHKHDVMRAHAEDLIEESGKAIEQLEARAA
jgi:hypothetical protein